MGSVGGISFFRDINLCVLKFSYICVFSIYDDHTVKRPHENLEL